MFLMQNPPDLTDRTTLLRNRKRAAKAPADFLRQAVADEVHERLTEVNRTFTSPLIVTGHPEIWVDSMPDATICADEDILQVGGLSPRIAPMAEIRDLGGLLQRAGFALPVADATPFTVNYNNAFHLMHDLRAMGEANAELHKRRWSYQRNLRNCHTDRMGAG